MYLANNPLKQDLAESQSFQVEFNRFEFKVFFLLDWLPNQG